MENNFFSVSDGYLKVALRLANRALHGVGGHRSLSSFGASPLILTVHTTKLPKNRLFGKDKHEWRITGFFFLFFIFSLVSRSYFSKSKVKDVFSKGKIFFRLRYFGWHRDEFRKLKHDLRKIFEHANVVFRQCKFLYASNKYKKKKILHKK